MKEQIQAVEVNAEIDAIFKNRMLFSSYKTVNNNNLTSTKMTKQINQTLLSLYSDEEIKKYFWDCIVNIQSDANTWIDLSADKLYIKIMGRKVQRVNGTDVGHLDKLFLDVYKENVANIKMFPSSFVNGVMQNIKNHETLKEYSDTFKDNYKCNLCGSFASFLDKYIIPQIGEQAFCDYINTMTVEFCENINVVTIQNVNLDVLRMHIFGYTWSFDFSEQSAIAEFNLLILKQMFPYVIHTYRNKEIRQKYYQQFGYDLKIVEMLEEKFNSFDTENYRLHSVAENYDTSSMDFYGVPANKYFQTMYEQMNLIIKEERDMPTYRNFMNTVNEVLQLPLFERSNGLTSMQNAVVHNEYDRLAIAGKETLFKNNKYEFPKNTWKIYYKKADNYKSTIIDFTNIPSCKLRADLKEYVWNYINDEHTRAVAITQVNTRMIRCFEFLTEKYGIRLMGEIEEWMILSFLNDLDVTHHLSPASISNILSALKVMFATFDLENNPTDNLTISHVGDHMEPTKVIPNDILLFLDKNIHRIKQKDCGLIYRIASETGWRFSEIRNLTIDALSTIEGNDEFALISTKMSKTKKARIKHRYGDIIEDNITIELYHDVVQYIEDTKQSREKIGSDLIFFRVANGQSSFLQPVYYNRSINNFLDENNVRSIDETYTDFSAMQTRKTVASNLISNGASEADVQKKLCHISKGTTRKYYMEVERKKLSELNHEFYKEKFDVYMDEEKLKLFTEEERRILYVDFCVGKRQVELGECSKHPSEGRCASLGYTSCAKCPKLCTGKKYLPRWEELLNDSEKILEMFIEEYSKYNIPEEEYSKYIEYKQEKELHDYYLAVIEKIGKEN